MAQRSPPLNDLATSWLVAFGTIMSALMSSSPTTRMATTTVVAVSTASTMLSGRTGSPTARAYSSSLATAKRRGRRAQVVTEMSRARAAKTYRSVRWVVRIDPKRYFMRFAGVPLDDLLMMTTPAAMPP